MAGDVRANQKLVLDGDVWVVVSAEHYKREQRRAIARIRMKSITTGKVIERNFPTAEPLELADLELRDMQFLYREGDHYVFMDETTYEQIHLSSDLLGDAAGYLKENATITVTMHEGRAIGVELPPKVDLKIVDTMPAVRGNTVQNVTKAATLETGLVIQVPLFCNTGDVVRVSTRDGSYVERV
ncbi:MAG: elongation factor P [Candidatus Sumerlaeia bacterium]|nr:elongation factor P [Candidatus Sumerlaeia bacterium]